jgi:ATP-dependent exoDNAse (exonuclease V) beta subunit
MATILPTDRQIQLPDFTLVTASAGSGKTHTLTLRFLQLLLSARIRPNDLQHILAVTFTNNAALEMKRRVVEELKQGALGNRETLQRLQEVVPEPDEELIARSLQVVNALLDRYSDFQVHTIDSFLTRVLKVSALEFGLPPSFDVVLESDALLDEAFLRFAQTLATNAEQRQLFESLILLLNESRSSNSRFLWNPFQAAAEEIRGLFKRLNLHVGRVEIRDLTLQRRDTGGRIIDIVLQIEKEAKESSFELTANYSRIIEAARVGNLDSVINKSLLQSALKTSNKPSFAATVQRIERLQKQLQELVGEYQLLTARQYYQPYLQAQALLAESLEAVKRLRGNIDLSEANRRLATSLVREQVPEIYYSLGERIHHYLIDEFQDTNRIQWTTLRPLVEESLSQLGSLFIVGDTKQAIYTFRGGDWQIMARMIENEEFPSAPCRRLALPHNFRSGGEIVAFTKKVFHEIVPQEAEGEVARLSGLSDFVQEPLEQLREAGYVKLEFFEEDEIPVDAERERILEIIRDCLARGYRYRDIAILTPKNKHVVNVSGWLNQAGIRFLSHSSLDIRTRPLTGEVLALLRFLDSPIDDLAFATFLLGRLFCSGGDGDEGTKRMRRFLLDHRLQNESQPLYAVFRRKFPELWQRYFERLFNVVGYLPVYDLVVEIYRNFEIWEKFPEEEASSVKLLEVVRVFETSGLNNLKDFLSHAEEESQDADWNIPIAPGEDAVTVMTVHKAKGLGFPIVLVLFYDARMQPVNLFLHEERGTVEVLRITSEMAKAHPSLQAIYEQERQLKEVDELNRLYVALTRAREELYVLSRRRQTATFPSKYLPAEGYERGKRKRSSAVPAVDLHIAPHLHPVAVERLRQRREQRRVPLEETRRGDFIHNVLASILSLEDDVEKQVEREFDRRADEWRTSFDRSEMKNRIVALLKHPALSPYFTAVQGRIMMNEQEITAKDGQLFRLDRIVVDDKRIMVIDYKTGREQPEYVEQVRAYMDLAREAFPGRKVQGMLAYVDLNLVRSVG